MCIIAALPVNTKCDDVVKEELENCFDSNPDGAGFMYSNGKEVVFKKGYFSFNKFWEDLKHVPEDKARIAHFRIATSGKVSPGVCHPFPVCGHDYGAMRQTEGTSEYALCHNGILSFCTPKEGMKANYSDTMNLTRILTPIIDKIKEDKIRHLIELATGTNKFVVMNKDEYFLLGDFNTSKKTGICYSNYSYMSSINSYKSYYDYYDNGYSSSGPIYIAVEDLDEFQKTTMEDVIASLTSDHWRYVEDYELINKNILLVCLDYEPYTKTVCGLNWYKVDDYIDFITKQTDEEEG